MKDESTKNPTPAPGQIWQWMGDDVAPPDGPHVIRRIDKCPNVADLGAGGYVGVSNLKHHPAWRCVGVETPAGRVMVGERRRAPWGQEYPVLGILDPDASGRAGIRIREGIDPWRRAAEEVVTWPLVTEERKPNPYREPAQWNRVSIGGAVLLGTTMRIGSIADIPVTLEQLDALARGGCREVSIGTVTKVHEDGTAEVQLSGSASVARKSDPWSHSVVYTFDACDTGAMAEYKKIAAALGARGFEMTQEKIDALAYRLGLTTTDPRAEREQRRREIDAVLREDARMFPEFATARRAAVMAWHEVDPSGTAHLADALLSAIHLYEGTRGGGRRPATDVQWNSARDRAALAAYERARGLP